MAPGVGLTNPWELRAALGHGFAHGPNQRA